LLFLHSYVFLTHSNAFIAIWPFSAGAESDPLVAQLTERSSASYCSVVVHETFFIGFVAMQYE